MTDDLEPLLPFISTDLAIDVAQAYFQQLDAGLDAGSATAEVFRTFASVLQQPDEGPVVFLAVAATQVRKRCLLDAVREGALALIDNGDAELVWKKSSHGPAGERKQALAAFRQRLEDCPGSAD